jgi:hypothetical protein
VLGRVLRRRWPLWVPPGHFYSPIPAPADLDRDATRIFASPATLDAIDLNEAGQLAWLDDLAPYARDLPFGFEAGDGLRFHYGNGAYDGLDATVYACMLRHLRPARVVEVGSGHSSALALDVSERLLAGGCSLTCVEPYPETLLSVMRPDDLDHRVALVRCRAQDADPNLFASLSSGDFLFIDSTHVAKAGSDVNHLMFDVLPRLQPGVVVHFHDVHYPFEYPREWAYEGRAWTESYVLRAFLQYNAVFQVIFFTDFLHQRHHDRLVSRMPRGAERTGSSIWLRRVS